ncbi:MAG: nitrilase-related carbon-nitrogen hydrolase, partial [Alistipes sp.]
MKLDIAICQVDMEWEETLHNLTRIEKIVAEAAADIVVLPEMFATGFKLRPSVVAEPMDGPVVTAMHRWAHDYNKA